MADEYGRPPDTRDVAIPDGCDWQSLKSKRGAELEGHYTELLPEPDDLAEEIIENLEAGLNIINSSGKAVQSRRSVNVS